MEQSILFYCYHPKKKGIYFRLPMKAIINFRNTVILPILLKKIS